MKKKFLGLALVLTIVLAGCGAKDYTDVNLYKDAIIDKYDELAPGTVDSFNKAIKKIGIKKSFDNYMNDFFEVYDNSLDYLGDNAEEFYNNFEKALDSVDEVPVKKADIDKAINDFEEEADTIKDATASFLNQALDTVDKMFKELADKIKNLTNDQVKDMQEFVGKQVEEGKGMIDSFGDYISEEIQLNK